jgi:hypothetical protein
MLTIEPVFTIIKHFIKMLLYKMFYPYEFIVKIFLIGNIDIKAKFLARYFSKKLSQNYRLRELINPLKIE